MANTANTNIVFSYTGMLSINVVEAAFTFNPREQLISNFTMQYNDNSRYLRICTSKVCDLNGSYRLDLKQLSSNIFMDTLITSRSFKLEEKYSPNSYSVPPFSGSFQVVVQTVLNLPLNTILDMKILKDMMANSPIQVFFNESKGIRDVYRIEKCRGSICKRIEWSDNVTIPEINNIDVDEIRFVPR